MNEIVESIIAQKLDDQYCGIIEYMNQCMTQKERDRHEDNICSYLEKPESLIAWIKLTLMANGK